MNVTSSPANVGNITACGTSSAQYLNYTLDGTNYSVTLAPADTLYAYTNTVQGTTLLQTSFRGSHLNHHIYFDFKHATAAAGTYAITDT